MPQLVCSTFESNIGKIFPKASIRNFKLSLVVEELYVERTD